jgi:hypothetical protein
MTPETRERNLLLAYSTEERFRVMTHRTTARVVGGLFIVGTVAGVLGLVLEQPIVDTPDYLARISMNEARLATGAVLELVMGSAMIAIAVAIYPVLRHFSERLALGYVAARMMETVIIVIGTISLLTLLTVSRESVESGAADDSLHQALGDMLLAARDWGGHAVLDVTAFPLSALILNYTLYRARLVPPMLAIWGLLGAASYWAAGVSVLYGAEPFTPIQILLGVPLAVQEMALAVWLILKGFKASAFATEPGAEPAILGRSAA